MDAESEPIDATIAFVVTRLHNPRMIPSVLTEAGLTVEQAREFLETHRRSTIIALNFPDDIFSAAPSPIPSPRRFSDGLYPCVYTSVDRVTAEAEVIFHLIRESRPYSHYDVHELRIEGHFRDIRSHGPTNTIFVTEEHPYTQCRLYAATARVDGYHGLVTYSARHLEGVNVPIWEKGTIKDTKMVDSLFVHRDGQMAPAPIH